LLILAMSTLNEGREEAGRRGIARDYILLAAWPNLLWMLYPVAFGLTDGGNVIGSRAAPSSLGCLTS
jgi:bacteriorhodopsin